MRSSEKILPLLKGIEGTFVEFRVCPDRKHLVLSTDRLSLFEVDTDKETSSSLTEYLLVRDEHNLYLPRFELVNSESQHNNNSAYNVQSEILLLNSGKVWHIRLVKELAPSSYEFVLQRQFSYSIPLIEFRMVSSNHFVWFGDGALGLSCFDLSTNLNPNTFRMEDTPKLLRTHFPNTATIGLSPNQIPSSHSYNLRNSVKTLSNKWVFTLNSNNKITRRKILPPQQAAKKLLNEAEYKQMFGLVLRLHWNQENRFPGTQDDKSDFDTTLLTYLDKIREELEADPSKSENNKEIPESAREYVGFLLEYLHATRRLEKGWEMLTNLPYNCLVSCLLSQIRQLHIDSLPDEILITFCDMVTKTDGTCISVFDREFSNLNFEQNDREKAIGTFFQHKMYSCLMKVLLTGEHPDYLVGLNLLLKKVNLQPKLSLEQWRSPEWVSIIEILDFCLGSTSSLQDNLKWLPINPDAIVRHMLSQPDRQTVMVWLESEIVTDTLLKVDPASTLSIFAITLVNEVPKNFQQRLGFLQKRVKTVRISQDFETLSQEQQRVFEAGWSTFCILVKTYVNQRVILLGTSEPEETMYEQISRTELENHLQAFAWLVSQDSVPVLPKCKLQSDALICAILPELSENFIHTFLAFGDNLPSSTSTCRVLLGEYEQAIKMLTKDNIVCKCSEWRKLLGHSGSRREVFERVLQTQSLYLVQVLQCELPTLTDVIYVGQERDIVDHLMSDPLTSLAVMDIVYTRYTQDSFFQEKYFRAICTHRQKDSLAYVKKNLLPTDQMLKVCAEFQRSDCLVVVLLRVGRTGCALSALKEFLSKNRTTILEGTTLEQKSPAAEFFYQTVREIISKPNMHQQTQLASEVFYFLHEQATVILQENRAGLLSAIVDSVCLDAETEGLSTQHQELLADMFSWYPESVKAWHANRLVQGWREECLESIEFTETIKLKRDGYKLAGCGLRGRRKCYKCDKRLEATPQLFIVARPPIEHLSNSNFSFPSSEGESFHLSCCGKFTRQKAPQRSQKVDSTDSTTGEDDDEFFFEELEQLEELDDLTKYSNLLEISDLKIERFNKQFFDSL